VSVLGLEIELGSEILPLSHFRDVLSILHLQVSGDKNEEQVLNAIEAYTEHRPEITSRAINLLFDIARIERCNQLLRALKVSTNPGGPSKGLQFILPHLLNHPPPPSQDTGHPTPRSPTPSLSTSLGPALTLSQDHGRPQFLSPNPNSCPQGAGSG